MVVVLILNVLLFLPVFACFVLILWFGCRTPADDGPGGGGGDGGTCGPLPGPLAGPGAASSVIFAGRDDLARSA